MESLWIGVKPGFRGSEWRIEGIEKVIRTVLRKLLISNGVLLRFGRIRDLLELCVVDRCVGPEMNLWGMAQLFDIETVG